MLGSGLRKKPRFAMFAVRTFIRTVTISDNRYHYLLFQHKSQRVRFPILFCFKHCPFMIEYVQ